MDDHKEGEAISKITKVISFKSDLQLLHLRATSYDSLGDLTSTIQDCEVALCVDSSHTNTLDLYQKVQQ
ncbi:hypothetical protein T459_21534 [Capsicum annuum]|uniref:Uncharacterized protein n=1 Tax=Capsicum annuum TaxID=4072 RepID=A0A2G2YWX2_CAPAN|nr:hypothetical protein T459_21534 [Capsicum annuum]